MLWEPALTTDKSTVPEAMSSINDFAVSKLLFMVVAITPVGPVFSHPLQYKPKKKHGLTAFFLLKLLYVKYFLNTHLPLAELGH